MTVTVGRGYGTTRITEGMVSLRRHGLSLEELERRLESSLAGGPAPNPSDGPGAPCQCDGQDCLAVCESHCLIHYV